MRHPLRQSLAYGIGLLLVALATVGCEPEFEDDVCTDDDDCFPDESCVEQRCELTENECGGREPLDHEVGDPCGPCDLDLLECTADGNAVTCDGNTPCPELDLITTQPTDIASTSATFHGKLEEFPHEEELVEVGFCWAQQDDLTLDDDCAALDEVPDAVGDFSLDVDGLRPGTVQYVRAYSISDADTEELANILEFQTEAPPPEGLQAEGGPDVITVSWDEAEGATGYELLAQGQTLAEFDDPQETSYEDETAPAGFVGAPQNYEATTDVSGGVEVSWDAPETGEGASVEYELIALYPDATSEPSDSVEGNRSAPQPTGYELYIGDDDPSDIDWIFVSDEQSYFDDTAPLGVIFPGSISASKGEFTDFVRLEFVEDPTIEVPTQLYRIRATYGENNQMTGETTSIFDGQRAVGPIEIQWFRNVEEDGVFPVLIAPDADLQYDDEEAPDDGSVRYYHANVSAADAIATDTNIDTGYVATTGSIDEPVISNVEATSAEVTAAVTSSGIPPAEEHGFCYSTETAPEYPDDDCIELGATDDETDSMAATLDELAQGTHYYVRAFVDSELTGTTYSEEVEFTTSAPVPQGLTTESSVDAVTISWDQTEGATGYRLYADDSLLQEIEEADVTEHDDDEVATAGYFGIIEYSAQGTVDGIEISWEDAGSVAGGTVEYELVATYPDADSERTAPVEGARSAPAEETIQGYELTIDGGEPIELEGDVNEYFDEDAPLREIDPGEASATKGEFDDRVELTIIGAEATDAGARAYELRAVFGEGDENDETTSPASFEGHRDTGDFEYQWYRTSGEDDVDEDYTAISGATEAEYSDEDAPDDGSQRYYRAEISAPGAAETVTTEADFGHISN